MSDRHVCPTCGTSLDGDSLEPGLRWLTAEEGARLADAEKVLASELARAEGSMRRLIEGGAND